MAASEVDNMLLKETPKMYNKDVRKEGSEDLPRYDAPTVIIKFPTAHIENALLYGRQSRDIRSGVLVANSQHFYYICGQKMTDRYSLTIIFIYYVLSSYLSVGEFKIDML